MTDDIYGDVPELTPAELARATDHARRVPPDLRREFVERLRAWRATWSRPGLLLSSDTRDYTRGQEFEDLVALGPAAAPLVVEAMALEPDGFFLLAALERWQGRDDLVATTPELPLESQQSRARRAVRGHLDG